MKQYRVPAFERLRDALRDDGINLRVAYSDPPAADSRNDDCDLSSELGLKVKGRWMFAKRLLYQPLLREVFSCDLVIAEQANKYLLNYLLIVLSLLGFRRVAFWGLGENRSADRSAISEWLRRRIINKVDWWFAYTRSTREYLISNGMPPQRITVVQNAIDTREFSDLVISIRDDELSRARWQFGIGGNDPIALFCGALLPDKGIRFLLEAAVRIKLQIPQFHLFIVGGGAEREVLEAAAQACPWVHSVGPRFGREKALFFRLADVFLLPGRVGLAILDAFAAGLPLISTDISYHGPEIEYLEHGCNGLVAKHDVENYASQVVSFFSNSTIRIKCAEGASESGRRFSMDVMVSNFRGGIHACLASQKEQVRAVSTL